MSLDALNEAIGALVIDTEGQDAKHIIEQLAGVREARRRLHRIEANLEAAAARAMTQRRIELPALGIVAERRGGTKRTDWDHPRVASVVARRYAVDAYGEIDTDLAELAECVAHWLLDFVNVSYWRAGKLRELGVDPDQYATCERGRRTVHLIVADKP